MLDTVSGRAVVRAALIVVGMLFVATSCRALPIGLLQSAEPTASPGPSATAPQTSYDVCLGVIDLGLAIDGLRDENLEDAGVIGLLGAVGRALVKAEGLAAAVDDTYTPLTIDLSESLVDLRDTLEALGEQRTLGASVAIVGASIAQIGVAMDALSLQLQTSCLEPIVEAISAEDG